MQITLKAARVNKGLSQKMAAKMLGISNKTLGLYENGKAFPRIDRINQMGRLYGVDKDKFIFLQS